MYHLQHSSQHFYLIYYIVADSVTFPHLLYDWLIVCCLKPSGKYFMHFHDDNKLNIWYINRNKGGMGATNFDCHRKSMERRVGTNKYVICSDCNSPTLYRSFKKLGFSSSGSKCWRSIQTVVFGDLSNSWETDPILNTCLQIKKQR